MHFVECFNFENSYSMKYPPVVSTLQEWLDGKLGIQGIDAVSCAFYVLSLLQRNETEESETAYQYPYSKIVDDHSLSYWPQNSWSDWGYTSIDDPVATECVSAPIQGYEIEHLGNDLSPSLKSFRNEDSVAQERFHDKQCFSLPVTDQVKRCHEVFSVHGTSVERDSSVAERKKPFWANDSACVGFFKHKLNKEGIEEKYNSYLMADKMIQEKTDDLWKSDLLEADDKNHLLLHEDKLLWSKKDDGSFFSWNTTDDAPLDVPYSCRQEKCSEYVPGTWERGIFCKEVKSTAPVSMPNAGTGIKCIAQNVSGHAEEDKNLAKLIAKFDHSVEAIWSPGSAIDVPETTLEQENLPWSFYSGVSPTRDGVSQIEQNGLENNVESISEENSFIHSGTNLISSIWSDQPFVYKPKSQANTDVLFSGNVIDSLNDNVSSDQSDLCCKLKVLLTKEELLQNEYNLFDWNFTPSDAQTEVLQSEKNDNLIQEVPEECQKVLCSKISSFPSLFSNINFREQFCHMENFQDADCSNEQDGSSCMINISPCSLSHFSSGCQDTIKDAVDNEKRNFNTLNHNREDSSFTEVLPRHTAGKVFQDSAIENSHSNELKQSLGTTEEQPPENKTNLDGKEEEEEDLLTSARTHFRPIHLENQESQNNPTCCYADGTTFVISSNISEVPFKRSESGTLYLENDDVHGTPKKFMEYKDKRTNDQSKCARNISKNLLGNNESFIPKFCVRQVEKCCQTDESEDSSDDLSIKRMKHDYAEKEWDFDLFSPGNEVVESVENYLDKEKGKISLEDVDGDEKIEDPGRDDVLFNDKDDSILKSLEAEMYVWNRAGCKCNNNYLFSSKNDSLKAFGGSFASEKGGLWEPTPATRLCQSRYSIWSGSPGPQTEPCPVCETLTKDKMVQHTQLREELSEDGEQLLSDLSSLEPLQLSSGWLDDALEQSGWGTEPNLLTRVSSRRRYMSWGQFGEG